MAHARSILLVAAAFALAGCASVRQSVGGWLGEDSSASTREGSVYYAASDGLVVRDDASGSAKIVGRLALHEKVVRTKLQAGYAYVVADRGLAGWVDNAQLIWRLPAAPSGAAAPPAATPPAGTGAAPAEEPAAESAPLTSPVPAATPEPVPTAQPTAVPTPEPAPAPTSAPPTPRKARPEMFDPY